MRSKLIVGVDLDGVLADCIGEWLVQFNFLTGSKLLRSDLKTYTISNHVAPKHKDFAMKVFEREDFFSNLPLITGAKEGVKALIKAGYEVVFVTKAVGNHPNILAGKSKWIKKHFPDQLESTIFCSDKSLVNVDYLIDDSVDQIEGINLVNYGTGILFGCHHNESFIDWAIIEVALDNEKGLNTQFLDTYIKS